MIKHKLRLIKENQCRDLDTQIDRAIFVIMRYIFLIYYDQIIADSKRSGDMLRVCCDEMCVDSIIEAWK